MPIIKDKSSIEWVVIKDYCQNRLNELRIENDNDKSDTETAKVRGMIEAMKELLELDKEDKPIDVADTNYIS